MKWLGLGISVALASCGPQQQPPPPTNNTSAPLVPAPSAPAAVENSAPAATEKAAPPSLPEPKGPIDPKSVEAAGQMVQHYGALIEQHRFGEASKYWGDAGAAATFAKQLKPGVHLEIGDLGETEGAAGSIYTTVPVVFYGSGYRRPASSCAGSTTCRGLPRRSGAGTSNGSSGEPRARGCSALRRRHSHHRSSPMNWRPAAAIRQRPSRTR